MHDAEHRPAHAAEHAGHAAEHEQQPHPGPRTYVKIAIILGIITLFEVGAIYIEGIEGIRAPLVIYLIVLMLIKFALVAGFYMHLKFDDRLYTWLFSFGLLIAMIITVVLLALFANLF